MEVNLHYLTSSGELTKGPFKLSPTGSDGDNILVPFLHEPLSKRQILITGTVFYEGGSTQKLIERTFDHLSIKISSELLPLLNGK